MLSQFVVFCKIEKKSKRIKKSRPTTESKYSAVFVDSFSATVLHQFTLNSVLCKSRYTLVDTLKEKKVK